MKCNRMDGRVTRLNEEQLDGKKCNRMDRRVTRLDEEQ
jgi:hypothetical protein